MHVMQPVVLDTGWSSATNSPSSSLTADVTLVNRAAVSASLSSSVVNGPIVMDSQPQNVSTASFKTLNEADVCNVQPLVERSYDISNSSTANQLMMKTPTNPQKPPKKPLTPYMRFSKAVRCYTFL